jgi:hypothetical protein
MTGAKHFGHPTSWGKDHSGSPYGGWYPPGVDHFIGPADPVWGTVLDAARKTYGDPKIHFDTGDPLQDRHLVFGDGTALPADGTVLYHDAGSRHDWIQNDDGTASLTGPDQHPGPPAAPVGYRKIDDGYAPINAAGEQIAPQLGGVPSNDTGFFTDPKTGVLTPKNADGDYYRLGPDGHRSFFDRAGAPITGPQYEKTAAPRTPPPPAPASPPEDGSPTAEQQSGRTADAVRTLQSALRQRFSTISDAEEKLSEVLLGAHATTADGQAKLNAIQQKIVAAVNDPAMDLDTPAGQKSYLRFLRQQAGAVGDALAAATLDAGQQSRATAALATLYGADGEGEPAPSGGAVDGDGAQHQPVPDTPAAPDPGASADPGATDDAGVPDLPDPALPEGLDPAVGSPLGPAAAAPLASMLPQMLGSPGGFGGLGGAPMEGLGGLAPLAALASQLGDPGARAHPGADKTEPDTTDTDRTESDKTTPAAVNPTGAAGAHPAPDGPTPQPGVDGTAAGGPPAAAPVSSTVRLPDGSSANARSPQTAAAVRDLLSGSTTVDGAYHQHGLTLPPPGTPVLNPVPPTQLACGDIALFTDHYEPVLSSVKGYLNGQVVPLSAVTSSPDFLGFLDPTAPMTAGGPPVTGAPPAPANPAAAPMSAPAPAG